MRPKPQPKRRTQSITISHGCIPRLLDRARRNERTKGFYTVVLKARYIHIREMIVRGMCGRTHIRWSHRMNTKFQAARNYVETGMKVDIPKYYLCTCIYQASQWVDAHFGGNHGARDGECQLRFKMYYQEKISSGKIDLRWYQRCGISMSSY